MDKTRNKRLIFFLLGMLVFAAGYFIVTTLILPSRPEQGTIIQDWGEICLWQDGNGINLSVKPNGCFSTSCTDVKQQTGTVFVDTQTQEIHVTSQFVLKETLLFQLPCTGECLEGGLLLFNLSELLPNQYTLWFGDQKVGEVMVFSGRKTPRQCFQSEGD